MIEKLKQDLIRHEGLRLKPYRDTVNKLTIGVGRNLDDVGITEEEAMHMLENDIRKVKEELTKRLPVFLYAHGEVRARVLINMAFNMGIYGLMGFRRMLSAFYDGDFEKASREMIDSAWARQVGKRAIELAEMMRTGKEA